MQIHSVFNVITKFFTGNTSINITWIIEIFYNNKILNIMGIIYTYYTDENIEYKVCVNSKNWMNKTTIIWDSYKNEFEKMEFIALFRRIFMLLCSGNVLRYVMGYLLWYMEETLLTYISKLSHHIKECLLQFIV